MNIGIIGFGNMGQAIVRGFNYKQCKHSYFVSARNYGKLELNAEKYHATACKTNEEVVANSDLVIVAVKPYQVEEVMTPLRDLMSNKIIVSIVASYTFDKFQKIFGNNHYIVTVPNTSISVAEGVLVTQDKHSLNKQELSIFKRVFEPLCDIFFVEENKLDIAGTIAGCGPAFTAMYLEALGDAGVKYGLSRSDAYKLGAKMIKGVGAMFLDNNRHPGIIKDEVCSPNGTTIKGVASLEKDGFRGIVINAIDEICN